jgi:hypothetical protein
VGARKNKNITKKDPPQQPHHGLDKKITTEDSSHWCPHSQRSGARACCACRAANRAAKYAPVEEAHRPIKEEEVSQLDIVDDDDVYHGNDDDEEECVGSETMDVVDDDEEEQKVDEEEEEQGGVDVLRTVVVLKRESKLALKDTDLCTYFFNLLERMSCPNRSCGCLEIVRDLNARSARFERRHKLSVWD